MKSLLLLFLIAYSHLANAKTYYISGSGSDGNDGLSTTSPWKTVAKVSSFKSFVAGDHILFNRGEIFYGGITINNSGTSGNPITFGAYGTGARPIITGLTTVSSWTSLGGNIWESTSPISSLSSVSIVIVNGVNTAMGRYPNTGYFISQSHSGNSSITSSSLTGSTNWTGATIVLRVLRDLSDKGTITSQSGGTLNYSGNSYTPQDGYGFFIQNDARTLDVQNEWYYNPSTKKIRIYSTSTPTNVQVSTVDNLINNVNRTYISVDNIDFRGSNLSALYFTSAGNATITNCNISFAGIDGFQGDGTTAYVDIENNTIRECNNSGIASYATNNTNFTIIGNSVVKSGTSLGARQLSAHGGIQANGNNSLIQYNIVDSSGYAGIQFIGTGSQVRNNFVNHSCLVLDDGGGIYTNGTGINKVIDGNIVLNTIGNADGTNNPDMYAQGIYCDDGSSTYTITNNTSAGNSSAGYLFHNANNITMRNNTAYDNKGLGFSRGAIMIEADAGRGAVRNFSIKNNILFAKDATQFCFFYYNTISAADVKLYGTADSNYYARPLDDNNMLRTFVPPATTYYNISGWNTFTAQDVHSKQSPKTTTTVNDLRFEYNASSSSKTVILDGNYIDVRNVSYNGTITLAPYSSAVLIRNGASTNQPPVANAGSDKTITLPTNSVALSGSGSDPDGTISSYQWSKISGPSGYSIANPGSANTSITGLVQGVYQFQLKVTDNGGATGNDTIQVTVNAAPNQPPVANAGSDLTITLPTNSATLSGSGTDPDGTISSYKWAKVSGPSSYTIANANSATTNITSLVQGVYQFQLTVTDNSGATGTDVILVTVNPAANVAPTANAGTDQAITLPVSTITLSGSGTDADGTVVNYSWTEISGPSGFNIVNSTSPVTDVTGLVKGVYQFQLKVTDNDGAIGTDIIQITVNAAVNIPPVANAGSNQAIILPVNTIALSGSGNDADGTIAGYAWTQISGPSGDNISNSNSATTNVTNLVQGVYQFQLEVTDNDGAIGTDIMQVTVDAAPNQAPVANAGSDQSIILPVSTVTLSGSGTDVDGSVVSYAWTTISGPSGSTIVNSNSPNSDVTGLKQGVYKFQLTVTDNDGSTGTDIIQVTVNAAANIPPVANAGSDQLITLPVNAITLSGSGTDADGSVVGYTWTQISGPLGDNIVSSNSAVTTVTALVQGVFQFQLEVTDNNGAIATDIIQVTVNAAANIAPVANGGSDQTITLPVNSVTLSGSGSDADGTVVSYAWTQISGPAGDNIVNPNSPNTDVTGLAQGVYQFQLQVTDNDGAIGTDIMQLTVNAATNIAPIADAGSDQSIALPVNTVTLSGSGSDADGTVAGYAWTKISGPSSYNIVNANSSGTDVTGLVQGTYQFQLKVTDNNGATGTDIVRIIVNAAANIAPVPDAGPDQTITLPVNTVTLSGSGSDADGTVTGYVWTKISGPSAYNIVNSNRANTSVTGLVQGTYQFQLKVTDNSGATATDIIQITVNAANNITPVANAGPDQTITLPTNTITLSGSGSDADGTIASYVWTQISGPASYNIVNPNSPFTDVSGLAEGVYQFELQVTDNSGATGTDIMQVTVNSAANIPPVADAGTDKTVTLPINTVTLSGNGSDSDGAIVDFHWTKISGPLNYNIIDANSPGTDITGLVEGIYEFQLEVTDDNGATAVDTIQVTVNAATNIPPVANAGSDQTITLPVSTVLLSGSGSDADGTIVGYQWTQLSGPSGYSIVNAASASTNVTGLVQGVYQFELQVTDDKGAAAADTIEVIVNIAGNISPTANAGSNKTITLPANSVTLSGSGSDADGTVVGYSWTEISGPATYNIVSATSASTNITGLVQGVYQFQLQVTDNNGATGTDVVRVTVNAAPNQSPVANAGSDLTITLPINSVTLSGSGSDADGTVVSYRWTKISGPSSFNFVNSNSATTDVNNLVKGVYKFQLRVTDNNGATGTDIIQITVNTATNQPPVANAGPDQSITLPANAITLSGSGTDADGTVVSYSWAKISGPSGYNIVNANSAGTNVTGLVQGLYQFQLKVTDNKGAIGIDIIQVTVNPAPNQPPVADAGLDQTITLPLNSVTISGSGNDADGTVVSYQWMEISGPSTYSIVNPTSGVTDINNLTQGTYQFQLTVTDNSGAIGTDIMQVIVNAAPNLPPVADAGTDWMITLPVNSLTVSGGGSDADGAVVGYQWTKISGPTTYTIVNPTSSVTDIKNLVQGVYQFQLEVTDNNGATSTDLMQVTVNPAPNNPPVADAGADKTITLPTNSLTISGSGNDVDGIVVGYQWTKISGPSAYTIVSPAAPITDINGLAQGTYQFQLKVTDNNGATGIDVMQVTVNAAANQSPVANAGIDKVITLPTKTATVTGSGSDPDGTIVGYQWTKISGPSTYNIVSPSSAATTINNLVQGVYQFQLKVTDNSGATSTDVMQLTVNPAPNQPPVANAGTNKTITLPTNSITVSGSGSDADGTVVGYQWTKISGPSSYAIANPSTAATSINNLVQGVYQFQLTVTDNNGAIATDVMRVTVNAAPNQPPVADAGSDWTITLPTNSLTVSGSGSDADGTIVGYQWTKISGPSSYTIVSPTSAASGISNLVQGVYQFQLKVTDNSGATSTDIMQVTVNTPPNQPPTADAGSDRTITLPTNSLTISGSGTDVDGTIVSYAWTRISGPSAYNIVSPTSATTDITGLVQGVYQFQLTVKDNSGAIATDIMQVTVNAASNQAPGANAGSDRTITLPTDSLTIMGSGNDADGTVVGYQWTKISGPTSYNIVSPTSAITVFNGLVQGVYQFELRVTDNSGARGRDTVEIRVNASANLAPVANAGPDQTITLPTNSVTLSGSGIDADGIITGYSWKQISGPSASVIASPGDTTTLSNGLIGGNYQFELTITDNLGAVGKDTVSIVVAEPRLNLSAQSVQVKVYPNPVVDVATVEIITPQIYSKLMLVVKDIYGHAVYKKEMKPTQTDITETINMSTFEKGFYIVTVYFDNKVKQSIKVIRL